MEWGLRRWSGMEVRWNGMGVDKVEWDNDGLFESFLHSALYLCWCLLLFAICDIP